VLASGCTAAGEARRSSAELRGDASSTSSGAPEQAVTVTGRVELVHDPRVFSIDGDAGGNLVVLVKVPASLVLRPGMQVRVSGEVVEGDVAQVARAAGIPLPPDVAPSFTGLPCLLVSSVTTLPDG
jgi:hypothetical protein